jgi:hypothetical protein
MKAPPMKHFLAAVAVLAAGSSAALADGLTPQDYQYLQSSLGLTRQSAVIAELTANEQQALHSAIDDLKTYPEGRDRQVRRYLALVYERECKRWAEAHPGQECSPAADAAQQPGKEISDRVCVQCHLAGTDTAPSYRQMATQRDWNAHRVEHALRHSPDMVPIKLKQEQLDALAIYINGFKN